MPSKNVLDRCPFLAGRLRINKAAELRLGDENSCEYLDEHKTQRRWISKGVSSQ